MTQYLTKPNIVNQVTEREGERVLQNRFDEKSSFVESLENLRLTVDTVDIDFSIVGGEVPQKSVKAVDTLFHRNLTNTVFARTDISQKSVKSRPKNFCAHDAEVSTDTKGERLILCGNISTRLSEI